ncbi:MAG TPA: hypothetical protein VHR86_01885, partial [Armatimonadota bacterium]|nr:hypothetical protein [Armatimonadota bacterium]
MLPLYGDFAYVQDIVPMLWSGYDITGAQKDYIDVAFTGFSRSRRNSDIYMARLDPAQLERSVSSAARAKIAFSRVVGEVLENNKNRVYYAQSLEWLTRPYVNTAGNPVFPVIYRKDSTGTVTQLTPDPTDSAAMGRWKYNATNFTYSFEFDYTSQDHPELNGKNKVTVYPMAGLVSFDRPMDAADVISADYTPAVMRLASSPQMESSPSVFLDTRIGPVQAGDGKRGYAPR